MSWGAAFVFSCLLSVSLFFCCMPLFEFPARTELAILLAITVFMVVYVSLILYFSNQFVKGKRFRYPQKIKKNESKYLPFVSIVVAFRNEAENLPVLLDCLKEQEYPDEKFEILLSDDFSTDKSIEIIRNYIKQHSCSRITVLEPDKDKQLPGKKHALFLAIRQSRGEIILATDADCVMDKHWVKNVGVFFSDHPQTKMLVAPVDIIAEKGSFFSRMQSLEFMSLTGSAAGSIFAGNPVMCNGANLAFLKKTYLTLKSCMPGEHFASGDDMFLLQCIHRHDPGSIFFIKNEESIVKTRAAKSFRQFFLQRVRWSSKATGYTNRFTIFVGATVAIVNLLLAALMLSVPFSPQTLFLPVLILFFIKLLTDVILVVPVSRFLKKTKLLLYMPFLSAFYPFYVSGVLLFSFFYRGHWKDRRI